MWLEPVAEAGPQQRVVGRPGAAEHPEVAAIEEVALGAGNYLLHPTTLANYRKATWDPGLFTHSTMRQWLDKGMSDLIDRAHKIAQQRIAGHDYLLDAGTRHVMDRIYARAAREVEEN